MRKDRDFLDYVQLASSLGQNLQLHGIGNRLDDLRRIEENREIRESTAAKYRHLLFSEERRFAELNKRGAFSPRKRLFILLDIQCLLEMPFMAKTEYAGSFEAAAKYQAFLTQIDTAISEVEAKMSPEEITHTRQALDYHKSLPALEEEIAYRSVADELELLVNKLEALSVVDSMTRAEWEHAICLVGLLLVGPFILVAGLAQDVIVLKVIGALIMFCSLVSGIAIRLSPQIKVTNESRKEARHLRELIAPLAAKLPTGLHNYDPHNRGAIKIPLMELSRMCSERKQTVNELLDEKSRDNF